MTEKREKTSKRRLRFVLIIVIAVILIAAATMLYLFRDRIFDEGVPEEYAGIEPFTYGTGSEQSFALCGNGLAVASTAGLQLMDEDGGTRARSIFSMKAPAVSCSDNGTAAFFDAGGTALRVADEKGNITDLETEAVIITADMSKGGALAVCTEETSYKGLVTVYDETFSVIYRWYSGSDWLIKAALSPDGKTLAALCVGENGSVLHLFSPDSEDELGSYTREDELFFDIIWLSDSRLCLVGDEGLLFLGSDAEETGYFDLGGEYLCAYDAGGGQISLFCSRYLSGGSGTLTVLDENGGALGSLETERSLVSLSHGEDSTLALFSDGLALYSDTAEELGTDTDALGAKSALLRDDGKALLLGAYSGELRSIG